MWFRNRQRWESAREIVISLAMYIVLLATTAFVAPPQAPRCAVSLALPARSQTPPVAQLSGFIARRYEGPREKEYPGGSRARRDEALVARGIAGAVLLRIAASSRAAALVALVASPFVVIAPVVAVEALLFTLILVITGAASYWPANLVAMGMGAIGAGGCVNGLLVWWSERYGRPPKRRKLPDDPLQNTRGKRTDNDDSGNLVALTIGAITAAILGALP